MTPQYKIYGTRFSLYTGKVRSYFLKKGIPFDEVLSTVSVYKKFIVPRTGVRYIPVVQTPEDKVLQDTTVIIDELEKRFPENSVYPTTPKQHLISLLLETYGDEWLVIPAMHYRWSFDETNQPFVFQNFGQVLMPRAPKFIRARLGKKIGDRFRSMVPLLGIKQQTIPAIESSFTQLLSDMEQHFLQHDYLFGGKPSIADFAFIGPFFAHLYSDPYPGKLLREQAPAVTGWVERMMDQQNQDGKFLKDDQIPDTLLPILKRMVDEQLPVLIDTDKQLSQWRKSNPDSSIPRSIGNHQFKVEGVTGERTIIPYALWMFKRPVDYYQSLGEDGKSEVKELISNLGLIDALGNGLENNLIRVNNKLEFS